MILRCDSCEKKFVVPDKAITIAGRAVQCGSCGNKWKQFPIKNETNKVISNKKINTKKTINIATSLFENAALTSAIKDCIATETK